VGEIKTENYLVLKLIKTTEQILTGLYSFETIDFPKQHVAL